LSSFRSICPYHCNLFCCSTEIMSSNHSLSLNPLFGTLSCSLMPHIHLTVLIYACWSTTSFCFLTGPVSIPRNILLRKQLLYNFLLTNNDISFSALMLSVGQQEGHLDCKKWVAACWHGCGKVQICIWPSWCHCHSLSLAPVNPDLFSFLVLPLWCQLTWVVPDKIQDGHKTVVCVCMCVCVLIGKQWYQMPALIPSNSKSGGNSCISISTNSRFALTPISTPVHPVPVTEFTQPLQKSSILHHFVHATLYTTTFTVYLLLTTSTLYWIITNAYTTDTTWPSYSLLRYLLPFSTNHNLGFIHIYSHASILHIIHIKPFN